jgi:hypothetical protein
MPDHIENWIQDYLKPRFPDLVQPFQDARRIRQDALDTGKLSDESLGKLIESAHNPHKALSENVARMIGELADHFENAQEGIKLLFRDTKQQVRINALIALEFHNLSNIHEEMLTSALKDRSTQIRILAADKILIFYLQQLLPELDAAILREKDPRVKHELEWYHEHLK